MKSTNFKAINHNYLNPLVIILTIFLQSLIFIGLSFGQNPNNFLINIDSFSGDLGVTCGSSTSVLQNALSTTNAIGNNRKYRITDVTGATDVKLATSSGILSYKASALTKGFGEIIWDGSSNTSVFNASGLGGIDFKEKAYYGFKLKYLHLISLTVSP